MKKVAIIVHGGAATGALRGAECRAGCERAAEIGYRVLVGGGSALDAVEAAVRALEDDEEFNAGFGAVLNREGEVETEACVMTGDLRVGAVGAVPSLRHPVTLARRVMEDGEHVLLVGRGAVDFAQALGIAQDARADVVSPRSEARYAREKERHPTGLRVGDTVGAVAIDKRGELASATSTGGISWKRRGRVGDSPIPGAGCYARAGVGAASATGHGESILRIGMTRSAVDAIARGESSEAAAKHAVRELVEVAKGQGGIIVVSHHGDVAHETSTANMPWASVVDGVAASGV